MMPPMPRRPRKPIDPVPDDDDRTLADVETLNRELYTVTEAARLLGIQPVKLRRWLDGFYVGDRFYEPVIRPERTGTNTVTWAEFVEAGFLNQYRTHKVTLQHMRPIIVRMREEFGVPYPLAHFKPIVDTASKELVLRLQEETGLDEDLVLVRPLGNQLQWAAPVLSFLRQVEFDTQGVAWRFRPLGKESPVVIDPEVSFGIPQVRGVRTESIEESFAETGDIKQVADEWQLTEDEVVAALQWEAQRRTAA
jgi:uncharacterized protein (DUF433 family)